MRKPTRDEIRKRYDEKVESGDVDTTFYEYELEELHEWADAAYDEAREEGL
jgi:hypothetical protein